MRQDESCVPSRVIDRVAETLLVTHGAAVARLREPLWIELRPPTGSTFEARLLPLGPQGFFGWRSDPDVWAVAAVGTGRLRSLDARRELPARLLSGRSGVSLCCVVDRTGDVGWRMVLPDGGVSTAGPEEGFMLDTLKRAMGLPTPAPSPSASAAASVCVWLRDLATVAEAAAAAPRCGQPPRSTMPRLSWTEVLRAHPAIARWGAPISDSEAEGVIARDTCRMDWGRLRQMIVDGPPLPDGPTAAEAAWMDDGMFSRLILDRLPDPEAVVEQARPLLEPGAARRLKHFVHGLTRTVSVWN